MAVAAAPPTLSSSDARQDDWVGFYFVIREADQATATEHRSSLAGLVWTDGWQTPTIKQYLGSNVQQEGHIRS